MIKKEYANERPEDFKFSGLSFASIRCKSIHPICLVDQLRLFKVKHSNRIKAIGMQFKTVLCFQCSNGFFCTLSGFIDSDVEEVDMLGLLGEKQMNDPVVQHCSHLWGIIVEAGARSGWQISGI